MARAWSPASSKSETRLKRSYTEGMGTRDRTMADGGWLMVRHPSALSLQPSSMHRVFDTVQPPLVVLAAPAEDRRCDNPISRRAPAGARLGDREPRLIGRWPAAGARLVGARPPDSAGGARPRRPS